MPKLNFPVTPIKKSLYSREELYGEFDLNNENSYTDTLDFKVYLDFKKNGGAFPDSYYIGMMRSLHDFSIWNSVQELMTSNKIVAIMGGHKMERSSTRQYSEVAKISYNLTKSGFLMCSGGGPGAMEAAHLGAYFSNYSENELKEALSILEAFPNLPKEADKIIVNNQIDTLKAKEMFEWIKPVFTLIKKYPNGGKSLSIPTWLYGHEPSTPFASDIGKYFQNSIREDGLLAIAKYGVIYAEGTAGTIQEVFQDSAQNYYKSFDWFSPMIFFNKQYWTAEYPVKKVLDKLYENNTDLNKISYTDDINEVINTIKSFKP